MRLAAIEGNSQRLDGGAMFGNAPKALWSRWVQPDAENLIPLATRALLVREPGGRNVLLEAGIGAFFEPALRERYGVVEEDHVLLENLAAEGLGPADIDVVVLSHLHFDHAGGLLGAWHPDRRPELVFERATHIVSAAAWQRARQPHVRDRASFISFLPSLLERSGRLEVVDGDQCTHLGDSYRLHFSQGHTPGLLLTEVAAPGVPVVFAGDLVPARPWVHVPITMGYDRFPELLVDEKRAFLEDLHARGAKLFLTHDPEVAVVGLERSDEGRFTAVPAELR
ncbi:MAG: MBL fold metallo-hydrolase [Microthrixaceae bacterium]